MFHCMMHACLEILPTGIFACLRCVRHFIYIRNFKGEGESVSYTCTMRVQGVLMSNTCPTQTWHGSRSLYGSYMNCKHLLQTLVQF